MHIHGLFWVKDAPQYDKSTDDVVSFVDKYVTCQKAENSEQMEDLVNLQMHRHAKTCKKKMERTYVGSIFLYHQCNKL